MQVVAYNQQQLDVIIRDMYNDFNEYKSLAISYDKPFKEMTTRQSGYFFGGLVDSVQKFYKAQGITFEKDNIKENFYQACSKIDDSLLKTITRFNGDTYQVPKRLSEMDVESASVFIDKCLWLIDNARCFKGLILHPSLRYTWVRHINQDTLQELRYFKFPEKDNEYLMHLRKQACIWCGKSRDVVEAHHMRINNYGGVAKKPSDVFCVPLCRDCHLRYHTRGGDEFLKDCDWLIKYVDIATFLRLNYLRWYNKLG